MARYTTSELEEMTDVIQNMNPTVRYYIVYFHILFIIIAILYSIFLYLIFYILSISIFQHITIFWCFQKSQYFI